MKGNASFLPHGGNTFLQRSSLRTRLLGRLAEVISDGPFSFATGGQNADSQNALQRLHCLNGVEVGFCFPNTAGYL